MPFLKGKNGVNNRLEEIQKQMSNLLASFENRENDNASQEIETTLNNLRSIEKEWKSVLERLKQHEQEYETLIKELRILRGYLRP